MGVGLAFGVLTFASGQLYARADGQAFWAMAGLCALAVPLALALGGVLLAVVLLANGLAQLLRGAAQQAR